jgi:hypothetical protein
VYAAAVTGIDGLGFLANALFSYDAQFRPSIQAVNLPCHGTKIAPNAVHLCPLKFWGIGALGARALGAGAFLRGPFFLRTARAMPRKGPSVPFGAWRARTQTGDGRELPLRPRTDHTAGKCALRCGDLLYPPATSTQPHPCGRASFSVRPKASPLLPPS